MSKQYSDITQVNLKFDLVEIIEILSLLLFKLSVNHKGLTLNDDEIFMLWIMYDIVFFFTQEIYFFILLKKKVKFLIKENFFYIFIFLFIFYFFFFFPLEI